MAAVPDDWAGLVDRLLDGDRLAFLKINRLITACLSQLNAYDLRDEWEDLRQEVILSLVAAARAGRLRAPQAFAAYVQSITRNKFIDRLKRASRTHEKHHVPWDEHGAEAAAAHTPAAGPDGKAADVWRAVADLDTQERQVIEAVYREGKTYEQVARDTGIPLGTVKRRLRDGLTAIRQRFNEDQERD
jgi:RNA polymerase sigma-70 factor (ECF subfamily)